jgi:hypothetical protein
VGAHQVDWYISGQNTFIIADVTGDTIADLKIELSGVHTLAGSDFFLA